MGSQDGSPSCRGSLSWPLLTLVLPTPLSQLQKASQAQSSLTALTPSVIARSKLASSKLARSQTPARKAKGGTEMALSAMTLLALFSLLTSAAAALASLALECTRLLLRATLLPLKLSLAPIRPLAAALCLLWLIDFLLSLLKGAEARLRAQKGGAAGACSLAAVHQGYHRTMCGQEPCLAEISPEGTDSTDAAAVPTYMNKAAAESTAAADKKANEEMILLSQAAAPAPSVPASTLASQSSGNAIRRLLRGKRLLPRWLELRGGWRRGRWPRLLLLRRRLS